jgi:hypothetical protein
MHKTVSKLILTSLLVAAAASALAQGVPTKQPTFLHIFREQVKPGRSGDHAKWEAGWPAAYEKAKAPYNYIALASVTGPNEVWYVTTLASQAAYGEMVASESKNAALSAELDRLQKGDGEFLSDGNAVQAVARPDLSHGDFPDIAAMRFWEITTYRVKPGHDEDFMAAVKAYTSLVGRSGGPSLRWRTYQVVAGAPGGTYLVFSSVASFAEFDKSAADGESAWKGRSAEEDKAIQKYFAEGSISSLSNRYRLDPVQSYVPKEVREKDPVFWTPKPAAAGTKRTATKTPAAERP